MGLPVTCTQITPPQQGFTRYFTQLTPDWYTNNPDAVNIWLLLVHKQPSSKVLNCLVASLAVGGINTDIAVTASGGGYGGYLVVELIKVRLTHSRDSDHLLQVLDHLAARSNVFGQLLLNNVAIGACLLLQPLYHTCKQGEHTFSSTMSARKVNTPLAPYLQKR